MILAQPCLQNLNREFMQALSMDGRCKTFEATADGYGRGEAFAVAYLSPSSTPAQPIAILQARPHCRTHHVIPCRGLQSFPQSSLYDSSHTPLTCIACSTESEELSLMCTLIRGQQ